MHPLVDRSNVLSKGLTSALTDQGPYEFAVSRAGDEYIDLANTYLFVEAQIVADDDTALDAGADDGTLVCVGGTSNKSSSDFVHSHELGCRSAILIRKYHSMCSVA
jgi:hypothetical protein